MAQKLHLGFTVPDGSKRWTEGHDDEVNKAFRGPP